MAGPWEKYQAVGDTATPVDTSSSWDKLAPQVTQNLARDLSITPDQAAGIVGQLGYESDGLQAINERSPAVPGSRGGFGWAQWTGPRRRAFEDWSAQHNLSVDSPDANYGFLLHELQDTGEGAVLDRIRQAPDARTAGQIFTNGYLRPGVLSQKQRDSWTDKALNMVVPQAQAGTLSEAGGPWMKYQRASAAPQADASAPAKPWEKYAGPRTMDSGMVGSEAIDEALANRMNAKAAQGGDDQGDFMRRFSDSLHQSEGLAAGAVGLAADAAGRAGIPGADSVADWGYKKYQDEMKVTNDRAKPNDDITHVWDEVKNGNYGAITDYLAGGAGYLSGQALEALAAGAAGAVVGSSAPGIGTVGGALVGAAEKGVIKKIIGKSVESAIAKRVEQNVARGMTEEAAKVAAKQQLGRQVVGGLLGSQAFNMSQELGTTYGGARDEKQGGQLTGGELAKAAGFGTLAALTETAGDAFGIGQFFTKAPTQAAKSGLVSMVKAIGQKARNGALFEGAQELVQTYLERVGSGQSQWDEDAFKDYINSAVLGALGGAARGAGAGVMKGVRGTKDSGSLDDLYADEAAKRAAEEGDGAPPATAALPTPQVTVDSQGNARRSGQVPATVVPDEAQQGAGNHPGADTSAVAPAAVPALPAPNISVDSAGTARTAGQRTADADALDRLTTWAQEMGYTKDVQAAGRRHPGRLGAEPADVPVPAKPLALAAPTVTVDSAGRARTADQRSADIARRREGGDLGLSPDVQAAGKNHPGRPQPIQTPVDEAAHAAQTSPLTGAVEPTDGQKDAGNYRLGHTRIGGLDISIENPEGSERHGTDASGKPWTTRMAAHYGYVRRTEGADGDQVDVFVKPGTPEDYTGQVFVVDQVNPATGKFDEHKVMMGYDSQTAAEKAYRANYARGWKGMGKVTPMDMSGFKEWLKGDTTKPAAEAQPEQAPSADLSRQNRDRSRPASVEQMNRIANNPDYDRLGFGRSPNEAAPMVSVAGDTARIPKSDMGRTDRVTLGDGTKIPVRYAVIEASDALASHSADGTENGAYYEAPKAGQIRALNNGRTAALQEAYRRGKASQYRQAMIEDAQAHGVSPEAIRAKREPMLVRVYGDRENQRSNIGALSNPQSNLGMSATEQAANDARTVPVDMLDLGDTGSFDAASNRRFLDAFARSVQHQGEDAAQIRDGQGNYSRQFVDRARAAVFHRAYGDDALTALSSESADPDVRNVLHALTMAAPDFAGVEAGPLDIRPQLAQAVHQIRDARARGLTMEQHLAQQDMFGRDPLVDRLTALLWKNIRAPRRVSEALRDMALFVQNEQAGAASGDMFGGANVTANDVIERGENLIRSRDGREQDTQQDLFGVGRSEGGRHADEAGRAGGQPAGRGRAASGDAGDAASSEAAGSQVEEPGANQDLFGDFDLEPGVSRRAGAHQSSGGRDDAGRRDAGARRLPSLKSRAAAVLIEPEGSRFAVRVEAKKTLNLRVQDGTITSASDVASAMASIRKQPQENLMMLLTDKEGRPISVLRHSIGQKASTIAIPDVLIGHAARVHKAANMWLIHNHPSGNSSLSSADLKLSDGMARIMRDGNVAYQGLMAVGLDSFSNVNAYGDTIHDKIPPVRRAKEIPVMERTFVRRGTLAEQINPGNVNAVAQEVAGGKDGVMLLDTQLQPIAFLPMTPEEMGRLRGTGGLEKLLAGVEKSNAIAAITVVQSSDSVSQARNLNSALGAVDIRALDIVAGGESLARTGQRLTRPSSVSFESRKPRPSAGVSVSDARVFADSFMKKLPGAGRLKVSVVQFVRDIPEGSKPSDMAEGVYYPASAGGRIYLVADNLPTMDRLHQVLAHEIVGHFGVEALLGERFDGVLSNVRRLARVPAGERATGNEKPGDANYATMEAVGMRYPDYGAKARAREVLARMAETNSRKYFLQGLYAKMRAALRAMGFDLKLTTADLRQMVIDAGKFLRRTPADQAFSGTRMAAASMAASEGSPIRVTAASGVELGGHEVSANDLRSAARDWANSNLKGKSFRNAQTGWKVTVSGRGIKESLSRSARRSKIQSIPALPDLINRGVLGASAENHNRQRDPFTTMVHTLYAPLDIGSDHYVARMVVKENQNGHFFYDHDLSTIEKAKRPGDLPAVSTPATKAGADRINSERTMTINELRSIVKREGRSGWNFDDRARQTGSGEPEAEESRGAVKHGTPDAVRNRILEEGHARSSGLRGQDLGPEESGLNHQQDETKAPPDAGLFNGPSESRAASAAPEAAEPARPKAPKAEQALRDKMLEQSGVFAGHDTIKERLNKLRENWQAKFVQGAFDHFLSLKSLNPTAYMQARLSKGTDGATEYLVRHGAVKLTDGALDGAGGKGLGKILASLGGEHDHFMAWIAGNRAERLMAEGKENLLTPAIIERFKNLNKGRMADGRKRSEVYAAALKDLNVLQKSVLDVAQEAGLIDGSTRHLWEHEFYVPFYRVMEGDNTGTMGPGQIGGLVGQYAFKKLKGGTERLGDLTANTVANWSHLLSASMKNMAAKEAMESAVDIGIAEKIGGAQKGSVRIMENGHEQHYMVDDPLVLDSLTSLHYAGSNDPIMRAMRKFKHALTIGVTISPTFRIRNLLRDSIQAISIDSDIDLNPLANMVRGWKSTSDESATMRRLLVGGGAVRFGSFNDGQARNVKRLVDELQVDPSQVLASPRQLVNFAKKTFDWYQELGDRGETVNRAAIYNAAIRHGKSHLEASYLARDLMDFTNSGSWAGIRLLTQVVPFMNARLQGMYKLGRGAKDNPARFAAVTGAVALASAALYLTMKDDKDYRDLPDWARNNYWVGKIGGKMVYIPKPFEIGALGSVVERGTELAFGGDDYRLKDFAQTMGGILGDQLALDPVPQMIKPAMEASFNYDTFRERTIDTEAQQHLPPGDRFTAQTSAGAVALGRAINVSPQRIEHLASGYFGWLGMQALNVSDYLARPLSNLPDNPRRDLGRVDNWFVVGDFVKDPAQRSSKYIQRFYNMQNQTNQVYAAYNQARAIGDMDRAHQLLQSDEAKLYGISKAAGNQVNQLNKAIKQVERSDVPVDEKRARLDDLYERRNRLAALADEKARAIQ